MLIEYKDAASRHKAEGQKKAEPVDKLTRVAAQVSVDLLILSDQKVALPARHVADSVRTMSMAQHNPTAAPFMNGKSVKHMRTVTGNQIAASSHSDGA